MDLLPHEKKIAEYLETLAHLKAKNGETPLFEKEIARLEIELQDLKQKTYGALTPWQRVMICRHPERPHSSDYIEALCNPFEELAGDRLFGDDPAVMGGLAKIGDTPCVVIGQEKGKNTEGRIKRNFGMLHPEGFRKALRLMKMAEKFSLPLVILLDTPGAYPGLEAEERGQGSAIAYNLREMIRIATPIVVVIIGEGCSGGALGMGVGDAVGMLEHAYYSVISPEGCSSIVWKDNSKSVIAATALKLNAENLVEQGVIDTIIKEPLGGAHLQPEVVFQGVKEFILNEWSALSHISPRVLLERRYQKFRKLGKVA